MLRFARLTLSGFLPLLAAPLASACSAPQFDASKPVEALTIDQLLAANHYRRALAQLTSEPAKPDATPAEVAGHQWMLSRVELGLGELDAAMELAEKALAEDPKNAAFHVQAAAAAGRLAQHASMFKQLGLAKRAKKELDEATALDPKNADAIYGLMLFSNVAPTFLGGDKEKAKQLAAQLTQLDAPRGYLAQATLAHERKDFAAEEALLKKAVDADPASYEAHIAYAVFADEATPVRTDDADEQACLALLIDPSRTAAWQVLAELAARAECWPEIDGLLHTAALFNPQDLSPGYAAAAVLITSGKNPEMAQTLLKGYLARPQEGEAPSSGRARYQLALLLEKQGRRNEALDQMRLGVSEDPTMDDVKKEIKRLEHAPAAAHE